MQGKMYPSNSCSTTEIRYADVEAQRKETVPRCFCYAHCRLDDAINERKRPCMRPSNLCLRTLPLLFGSCMHTSSTSNLVSWNVAPTGALAQIPKVSTRHAWGLTLHIDDESRRVDRGPSTNRPALVPAGSATSSSHYGWLDRS